MAEERSKIWVLLAGLMLLYCLPATGQCTVPNMLKGDFHGPTIRSPWLADGKVTFRGTAVSDHTMGWNDIHQFVTLLANKSYELRAFVRTSRNMHDGLVGFRGNGLLKPMQMSFGPKFATPGNFSTVSVPFKPLKTGSYDVFVGFNANAGEKSSRSRAAPRSASPTHRSSPGPAS